MELDCRGRASRRRGQRSKDKGQANLRGGGLRCTTIDVYVSKELNRQSQLSIFFIHEHSLVDASYAGVKIQLKTKVFFVTARLKKQIHPQTLPVLHVMTHPHHKGHFPVVFFWPFLI